MFICDVPHLIKMTRNNLENSHGHLNFQSLMKGDKSISWSHIVSTVEEDMTHSLNPLAKIKEEHIHLSPQLRMRVNLAAQVLSSTMANAIIMRNRPEMSETAVFCKKFDRWFDCLNGRYLKASSLTYNHIELGVLMTHGISGLKRASLVGFLPGKQKLKPCQKLAKQKRTVLFCFT